MPHTRQELTKTTACFVLEYTQLEATQTELLRRDFCNELVFIETQLTAPRLVSHVVRSIIIMEERCILINKEKV